MRVRTILKAIGNPKLDIATSPGYWYFIYDDLDRNIYRTESVMVPRLSDLSLEEWVRCGKAFLEQIEYEHAG